MGPLQGTKIIELAGIGPGPFCGMMLADMGAEVICIRRGRDPASEGLKDCSRRGKRSIVLNLKTPAGVETFMRLIAGADALIEGFRPGVTEQLGIGPEACLQQNPKIVYGRMTGWGQTGPLAQSAGHDINYISLTGALHAIGRRHEKPVPPLNLAGDFGGGGMYLAFGVVCALLEARSSKQGQVIDAAMTDGSASLMAYFNSLTEQGKWHPERGSNYLDSGAHFYNCYETRDGKYISIAAIEPQFYTLLIEKTELDPQKFSEQLSREKWPEFTAELEKLFKAKTRDEWCELLEGTDVCFAPVLDMQETQQHPHNVTRQTYITVDAMSQPAPAPRFSRTVPEVQFGAHADGEDSESVLKDIGFSATEIASLKTAGVLG